MLPVREPQISFAPIKSSPRTLPLTNVQPEPTIFPLCHLVLSLIVVSRLSSPGYLLVFSDREIQCSFELICQGCWSKISRPQGPLLAWTSMIQTPWWSESMELENVLLVGSKCAPISCGFAHCIVSLPSELPTFHFSPKPCLQSSPIVIATYSLFCYGVCFVGSSSFLPCWSWCGNLPVVFLDKDKSGVTRHYYHLTVLKKPHRILPSHKQEWILSTCLMWQNCGEH